MGEMGGFVLLGLICFIMDAIIWLAVIVGIPLFIYLTVTGIRDRNWRRLQKLAPIAVAIVLTAGAFAWSRWQPPAETESSPWWEHLNSIEYELPKKELGPMTMLRTNELHIMLDAQPSETHFVYLISSYILASFNPSVGLYREAPNVAPDTYWVYSDAYLAGFDVSDWDVPKLTKWTPLVEGIAVPEATFACIHYDIDLGNGIRSEAPDCSSEHMWDWWMQYADRVLLTALNARNAGNYEREAELMAIAMSMWDGKGFKDKVYRADLEQLGVVRYETYKTALYYYMTGDKDALKVLKKMQERDPKSNRYGGIYTEYDDNLEPLPWTDTNIETTAVTLRALLKHYAD